jgi:predicted extracellular nuclease
MSRPRTLTRVALLFVMALVAFAARQTPAVSAAPPTDLFISEYLESTPGNRKAIEIYNGTSSAITLTSTYNVVLYVNGSATPASPINLTGSIPAGGVFVLAHTDTPAATGITANQTSGSLTFNGNDVVALRNGTTIVDVLGQIGNDPGAGGWGTDPTNTTDNTIRRKSTICAGDTNGTDAFNPATEYDGFVDGTTSGFGSHTANCSSGDEAPSITATNPVDNATNVAANTTITLNFSETVAIAGTVQVVGSVSLTQNLTPTTSDNMTFTLNPSAFTDGETVTVTVLGTQVTDLDTDEPPDNMAADFEFDFTIVSAVPICDQAFTPIYDIQGSGASVPTPGNVTTEGVVVGDFQTSAGVQGFFIQDPTGDANTATSDGIFVFTGTTDNTVNAGDYVRVEGYARERFNQTTLNGSNSNTAIVPAANIINCGTGSVSAVDVTMPFASTTFPEQYEGMLVRFPQTLVIAEYFNYDQFGEIVLALPLTGEDRPYTGTAIDEPGAPALARIAANAVRRITLDDNQGGSNPATLRHPNGNPFTLANMFRGGDHVANATGVLGYEFNLYRVFPTAPADYTAVNSRPASPEDVGGSLTVAAMNTLNFFITGDYPSNDPLDNKCGPSQTLECRGHDADQPTEFTRQRDKLLEALAGINADVIGLNEIENTPGVSPLGDPVNGVVAGLNDMLGAGTYAFIDTGVIGTDAIRVGLIYKPGSVTPVGSFQTLDSNDDPRFLDGRNRPALAQTFEEVGTGARFTVVVNHLKSKGSACTPDDPDLGDGQGNCNQTRLAAAQALVDWLATPDTTAPTVTINQASGQADPTSSSPINFTVVFSEPVIGFATGDVTLERHGRGDDGHSDEVSDGPTTYNVAVSGMTGDGTVIASIRPTWPRTRPATTTPPRPRPTTP